MSLIYYAVSIYGKKSKVSIDGILKRQKGIIQLVFFKRNCDSVSDIMGKSNILTVPEFYNAEVLN